MKLNLLILLSILALPFTVFAANEKPAKVEKVETIFKIETGDSSIAWLGKKVVGQHNGKIEVKEGELKFVDEKLVGGKVVVDMTSIKNEDLSGEMKDKLEGHLKSADFFDVEKYPTALVEFTKVTAKKDGSYAIKGKFTIKDKTKDLDFVATIEKKGDDEIKGMTKISIDRTKFEIRYGSGKFFKGLGDKVINDKFDLDITLVAEK